MTKVWLRKALMLKKVQVNWAQPKLTPFLHRVIAVNSNMLTCVGALDNKILSGCFGCDHFLQILVLSALDLVTKNCVRKEENGVQEKEE